MGNERSRARQLTTKAEFALIESSYPPVVDTLSQRGTRDCLSRARRLRDKQDDLLRKQRLANRERTGSKHGTRRETNERTRDKRQLFQAALERFDRRLRMLRKPRQAPQGAKRPRAGGKPVLSPAGAPQEAPRGKGARRNAGPPPKHGPAALRQKARSPRMKAIHAHAGSRGRRKQAARDARR